MEPQDEGIEATDLASLLHRFEEAVTPPATPTPIVISSATVSQTAKVTQAPLTIISNSSIASPKAAVPAQLHVRPKAVYSTPKSGISLLPFALPTTSRTSTASAQSPSIIIRASAPPPLQAQVVGNKSNMLAGTAFTVVPNTQGRHSLLLVRPSNQLAVSKALPKQVSTTKPLAKQASSTSAVATSKPLKISVSLETSVVSTTVSRSTTASRSLIRSASATSLSTVSTPTSLLQTMLLDKTACIIPKRGASKTKVLEVTTPGTTGAISNTAKSVVSTTPSTSLLPQVVTSKPVSFAVSRSKVSVGLSYSLPSSPTPSVQSFRGREADHDYCGTDAIPRKTPDSKDSQTDATPGNQISSDKEGYKETIVSAEESRTISSLDAELMQDIEYLDATFGPASPLVRENTTDDVLEDGEVMVDDDGNDSFPLLTPVPNQHECKNYSGSCQQKDLPEQSTAGNTVAFSLDGDEPLCDRRRGRRYRRRTELNTSPIREDTTDFFNKIPAFYTTLSIPTKPIKTSVFASATKSLGATDHLDLHEEEGEQVDSGLYNKVPAYRRCFTNTVKEVELSTADPGLADASGQQPSGPPSQPPLSSSLLSSSSTELNPQGSSSPSRHSRPRSRRRTKRRRLLSAQSGSPSGHSRSTSRSRSRHSSRRRSHFLVSRSRSHSRLSSRSCSTCSSASSSSSSSCGSSCSGCSRSRSRSRSRSCSTCSGSSRSRSRSQSPQVKRDWQLRGERPSSSRYSPQDGRHHHRRNDRWRTRSRSVSPARRAGWRSRSRSRRKHTHSRSSHLDEKAAQKKKAREEEKVKAMEERRVVYVGKIPESYTKRHLYQRFECFGEIKEVKLNFREHGDNYGFVTFAYACDAIAAKEKGNNIEGVPKFDLCFGGRRRFCPDQYADLDGNREIEEEYAPMPKSFSEELDYAALLRQHSSQQRRGGKL